jgi:hypothetical protein
MYLNKLCWINEKYKRIILLYKTQSGVFFDVRYIRSDLKILSDNDNWINVLFSSATNIRKLFEVTPIWTNKTSK